jgi:hypothetical protein
VGTLHRLQGSAGEDDGEWEDRPDAAEDDNAQEDDDEEEVWNNRRQKKPISPVRTRGSLRHHLFLFLYFSYFSYFICLFGLQRPRAPSLRVLRAYALCLSSR